MVIIGDGIKRIRKLKKKSQAWLSEKVGVTQSKISDIESGVTEAHPDLVKAIADALEVTVKELNYRHHKYKV